MDIIVNFTKSGPDDKPSRVTARATAINQCLAEAGFSPNAERVLLTGQYDRLVFDFLVYMNREGETYKTTSWPHDLPAPSKSCPVQLKIINAIALKKERVMHKGYTISFFIKTVSALSETQIKNDFYNTLAPRGGYFSVKAKRFDDWVGCTEEIIEGKTKRAKSLGKTAKTRLLTALRRRRTARKVF